MMDKSFKKLDCGIDREQVELNCETHGEYMGERMIIKMLRNKEVVSECPKCKEIRELAEREKSQAEETERKRRHYEKFLNLSNIPGRFKDRTFETFQVAYENQKRALAVCKRYADNFDESYSKGKSLILSGKPGTGKSHLAVSVIQAIYPKYQGQYLTLMDLIRIVRNTWNRNSEKTEIQVLRELVGIDLLVIDEIGVQYGTDGEQNIIFDVLDGRYREQMPTILLTNQDKEGVSKCIGERVFDRMRESASWVSFDWESYRGKK